MKKIFLYYLLPMLPKSATQANAAQITDYSIFDKFNFYVANDLGRNGYQLRPETHCRTDGTDGRNIGRRPRIRTCHRRCTPFENTGVRSVNDPLWMTNYELIYSHPELMIDWFPRLLGNHKNTAAIRKLCSTTVTSAAAGQCRILPVIIPRHSRIKALQISASFGCRTPPR